MSSSHVLRLALFLLAGTAVLSTMALHLLFGTAEPARNLRLRRWNQRRGGED